MQVKWNQHPIELGQLCKMLGLEVREIRLGIAQGQEAVVVIRSALGRRLHPYAHCNPHSSHAGERPRGRRYSIEHARPRHRLI